MELIWGGSITRMYAKISERTMSTLIGQYSSLDLVLVRQFPIRLMREGVQLLHPLVWWDTLPVLMSPPKIGFRYEVTAKLPQNARSRSGYGRGLLLFQPWSQNGLKLAGDWRVLEKGHYAISLEESLLEAIS